MAMRMVEINLKKVVKEISRNQEIAGIILQQLGGQRRLRVIIGAKNFIAVENGVSFKHMLSNHINYMKITLNGLDLYDVEFGRVWGGKYTVVSKHENVYADFLEDLIYNATGLCSTEMDMD